MTLEAEFDAHVWQRRFIRDNTRFKSLITGVGGGKTVAGCLNALTVISMYPKSIGAIIAPTYRMLEDATMTTFFELCDKYKLATHFNKGDMKVTMWNNAEVLFRSATEPERLRGPNLSWFWIDEASLVDYMCWQIMVGRLRREPELAWITTTPKGRNWVWDEFLNKPSINPVLRKHYNMVTYSTLDNIYLSDSYKDSLTMSYGGSFLKQEVYGEFVTLENLVYPNFNRGIHAIREIPFERIKRYYAACDFGFTNPSVFLTCGIDSDDRVYVVDELYARQMQIEDYIKYARSMKEKYKVELCYCDPSSPEYIDALNKAGVPAVGIRREVLDGILAVSQMLELAKDNKPRFYVKSDCVNTIIEFETYKYPEHKEGKMVHENPEKVFDHSMDALSYMCYTLRRMTVPRLIGDLSDLSR